MARKRRKSKQQRREEAGEYKHMRPDSNTLDIGQPPNKRWRSKRERKRDRKKNKKKTFPKIKCAFRFITVGLSNKDEE